MWPGMFAGIDEPLLRSLRQGQGQLQCGPARFAGISSSSAACVGIEYTARFNEARRERRDQRELERFVTALP